MQPEQNDADAIREALAAVERRVERACARAGRDPSGVSILPVTKTVDPERVEVAVAAGYRAFGENRIQEAEDKYRALASHPIEWHMIGHLQRNKVKLALGFVACIESVDRERLVERLADQAEKSGRRCRVLMQVNTSGAESQYGVDPGEAEALARRIAAHEALDFEGLMTIGRFSEDPEDTRDCFRLLRDLRDRLEDGLGRALPQLSMGMSHDLEVAVEEGATRVRPGSSVFGARPRP